MSVLVLSSETTIIATTTSSGTKFKPTIKIGNWEYVFDLEYDNEDSAYKKAYQIYKADIESMQKSLLERQGRWRRT